MIKVIGLFVTLFTLVVFQACRPKDELPVDITKDYPQLLNVKHTANDSIVRGQGYFTDHGSWMGFTIPEKESDVNGFCGPFDLDSRRWISNSAIQIGIVNTQAEEISANQFRQTNAVYYPGSIVLHSEAENIKLKQTLTFVDEKHTLLQCEADSEVIFQMTGNLNIKEGESANISKDNMIECKLKGGEVVAISFPSSVNIEFDVNTNSYMVTSNNKVTEIAVTISYFNSETEYMVYGMEIINKIIKNPRTAYLKTIERWNKYITANLRHDIPTKYNRILVKSIMTLISNWRSPKGGLLHDGVVPSHATGYFVGFWAWDSWKHAVALAHIDSLLAKNQIRAMFDYQSEEGMIADCIYTNKEENNWRDTKPPLAGWAINEIYEITQDKDFLMEMYPKLLKYHNWRYQYRDHDKNSICEFGSTDGTLEAAKWESGMDNAIRYDNAQMLKNSESAWSFDQESVDLNAYLCYERALLVKMADILGEDLNLKNNDTDISNYFYDNKDGYFYDKRIKGNFIREQGPEGWIPLWTKIATEDQAKNVVKIMFDSSKFSTHIPFPTVAADNPKFTPKGYWRGPIWLDQVYFAISGIRKYGYTKEADAYTDQVFTRLDGLNEDAPIHENYETNTGKRLKAPHFSWSAAHLIMLYQEYNKTEL